MIILEYLVILWSQQRCKSLTLKIDKKFLDFLCFLLGCLPKIIEVSSQKLYDNRRNNSSNLYTSQHLTNLSI